jgi:hypothetical protein
MGGDMRDNISGSTQIFRVDPIRMILTGAVIAGLSLLLTVVIPGIVAASGNVFYQEGVRAKLPQAAQERLRLFEAKKREQEARIAAIDEQLGQARLATEMGGDNGLLAVRKYLQEELQQAVPPISPIAFHLNPQLLLWPAIYTCLGWIIFLLPPTSLRRRRLHLLPKALGVGVTIYVFYEWPLWLRNFVLSDAGRTVYAYPNFDIHPASFVMQELTILGFCVLLATLWVEWNAHQGVVASEDGAVKSVVKTLFDETILQRLADRFVHWLLCSVLLGMGFMFFTNFFWTLVARYGDQRYFLSAVLAHLLWGISWIIISMPMIDTWQRWLRLKRQAIAEISSRSDLSEQMANRLIASAKEVQPFGAFALPISSAGALISFVIPLLKLF